ncbi:DUF1146 family protein [Lactobacillus sp. ESL0791]|uniref:DUF1146 family protein n=1 Tax=Lactobacillus sp. ESL0791 TaxID=2983234 RepID=UPI0023F762B7|nr:DUF1146 family protein [Lactobacillus sp. ESL0791]MDF7638780.1 DUF1146 family protein [Lactobacillus sp. ESL0791]
MVQLGIHAVINLIIYFITIALSFQALKAIQIEKFVRKGHTFAAQIIILFSSIALGYLVGSFFVTLINTSLQLSNFF